MPTKKQPSIMNDIQKASKLEIKESSQPRSGCCQDNPMNQTTPAAMKKGPKTRIIIKYDVGFNNTLYIRGKGASLSWEKGVPLKNVKPDEWLWETDALFSTCEFKILINDKTYETGNNHLITCGASVQYSPRF